MRSLSIRSITSTAELKLASADWSEEPCLGLDTEFVRTRTFYARLGLVQIASSSGVYLLDTVAVEDISSLDGVLQVPTTERILHSCGEDLGIFIQCFGHLPKSVFDTQIAAALVGLGFSLSYQNLVERELGVRLEKEETRSNWTRRPLSSAQLEYAAKDVEHLLALHDLLSERLSELGRDAWAAEEFGRLLEPERYSVEPADAWRRVKGAGTLDSKGLATLQLLAEWREEEAKRRDLARPFVVRDRALMALAQRRPQRMDQLRQVSELEAPDRRRHARALLDRIEAASRIAVGDLPRRERRPPRVPGMTDLVKGLQELVAGIGKDMAVAPELLAQRRVLVRLVQDYLGLRSRELPKELLGWRREVVGLPCLSYLDSHS